MRLIIVGEIWTDFSTIHKQSKWPEYSENYEHDAIEQEIQAVLIFHELTKTKNQLSWRESNSFILDMENHDQSPRNSSSFYDIYELFSSSPIHFQCN